MEEELHERILPFWMSLQDQQYGGMYGEVNDQLHVNKYADKGGVVTSRFLWTFSAAYRVTGHQPYLPVAKQLFQFLVDKVVDDEQGGLYWLVDYTGKPKDTRKHIYAQAFGVYACSEYYRATNDQRALTLAQKLYSLIETKGFNKKLNAYCEEFDRFWNKKVNEILSDRELNATITMNTHIHVLEAYTTLYKAWPTTELKERIENLLYILYEKIYDKETKYLGVFFNEKWQSLLNMKSFGHDIEASWLIDEAIQAIGMEKDHYTQMVIDIAENIANHAVEKDGSVINEQVGDRLDRDRVWWVQAEAAVGFYNAYQRTGDEKFSDLAKNTWRYIQKHIIDPRPGSEWLWAVKEDGTKVERNIADPWKASYHNGRFCLELIERLRLNSKCE